MKFKDRMALEPPKKGQKLIPDGLEGCLAELTFLITGVMESLERDQVINLIKRYGGRILSAPSRNLRYAVIGMEPGKKKIERLGKFKDVIRIDEDGLFDLIRISPSGLTGKPKALPKVQPHSKNAKGTSSVMLWTDKWKPNSTEDVVGNKGIIKKIKTWLRDWHSNHKLAKGKNRKAVLFSGPPGIGKTSAAILCAEESGFNPIEFNASDTRSKKSLQAHIESMIGNHNLSEYFGGNRQLVSSKAMSLDRQKSVLIMDEVDGMSSGDRGGMAELILLIKKSRMPIICICNDRASPKIRSLANWTEDYRFHRPPVDSVIPRIMAIAKFEGYNLSENVFRHICESSRGDLRHVINNLQIWSKDKNKVINVAASHKDVDVGIFDIIPHFLSSSYSSGTINSRISLYFEDSDLVPLMVQHNYLIVTPSGCRREDQVLGQIAAAADSISDGDVVSKTMRSGNNWSLAPLHGVISCAHPGYFAHGSVKRQFEFPGWLGKNSTRIKNVRLLRELKVDMSTSTVCDKAQLRLDYMPYLRARLENPLRSIPEGMTEGQAVDSVIGFMGSYGISRNDWEFVLDCVGHEVPGKGLKFTALEPGRIPTKIKSKFTRRYNSMYYSKQKID